MNSWIEEAYRLKASGEAFVMVTLISQGGSTPREVGAKMLVTEKDFYGTVGGGELEFQALHEARTLLAELIDSPTSSKSQTYPLGARTKQCCGGTVELFFEVISPGPQLYVFGAGHVGAEIVQKAKGLGFQLHLIDQRPEWLKATSDALSARSPDERISCRYSQQDPLIFARELMLKWTEPGANADLLRKSTYAVVLTHSHELDQNLVEILSQQNLAYLGLIGSEIKWMGFQSRLKAKGISAQQLERIECPMGAPIGGKTPGEIAISVWARILAIKNQRSL